MKTHNTRTNMAHRNPFLMTGLDTLAVLFLLSIEYGRAVQIFSIEGTVFCATIAMLLGLPYFLMDTAARSDLISWLIGRGTVAVLGILIGLGIANAAGSLPSVISSVPMTFLIIAGMVSSYVQFYSLFKLRSVK